MHGNLCTSYLRQQLDELDPDVDDLVRGEEQKRAEKIGFDVIARKQRQQLPDDEKINLHDVVFEVQDISK